MPTIVMLYLYVRIFWEIKKRSNQFDVNSEQRSRKSPDAQFAILKNGDAVIPGDGDRCELDKWYLDVDRKRMANLLTPPVPMATATALAAIVDGARGNFDSPNGGRQIRDANSSLGSSLSGNLQ